MNQLTHDEVNAAGQRIAGRVRPVAVAPGDDDGRTWPALEVLQHTGSFKARGAQNFLLAHAEAGALPQAGVTIVSGGNAGPACAWAARELGVRARVFLPETASPVSVDVPVASVAQDALGARRPTAVAVHSAGHENVRSILVSDDAILRARRQLWDDRRIAVEHAVSTALAALDQVDGECIAVHLCDANTDPSDLVH
ncbi:pyridoxal-phosphate dependent enzyme [Kitasatospora sp. NPDC056531]|uniref:pyridoxal-phosphate dependent enzyme n=1 Tax=Kitasatospora sp. NPDC056531 TaxID=3345856 RepID=UPI00369319D9